MPLITPSPRRIIVRRKQPEEMIDFVPRQGGIIKPVKSDLASVMGAATSAVRSTAQAVQSTLPAEARKPRVREEMPIEEKVIAFIETLKVPDGPDVGQHIKLRDWQKTMIRQVYQPTRVNDKGQTIRAIRQAVWTLARKNGKALDLNTKIQTPWGPRRMKDVGVGDWVLAIDGTSSRVTAESPIFYDHDCYRITFRSGESFTADAEHRWTVLHKEVEKTVTTEYLSQRKSTCVFKFPLSSAVQYPKKDFLIDPYTLGIWLAEGTVGTDCVHLGSRDSSHIQARMKNSARVWPVTRGCQKIRLGIRRELRELNLLKEKHLPAEYLLGSESQRRELLRGLLDGDGHPTSAEGSSSSVTFSTKFKHLAKSVRTLVASLGFKPVMQTQERKFMKSLGGFYGPHYAVNFTAYQEDYVFSLDRQNAILKRRPNKITRARYRYIKSIEKVPSVPVKCIGIDHPSHQFLIGDTFVPTHNTSLAAGLILAHLTGPLAIWNGQLFSVAFDVGQAALAFRALTSIVLQDKELTGRVVLTESSKRAMCDKSNSVFRALSSESRSKHGLNPNFVLFDEFAQFGTNRELFDVMTTSMGAQKEPLSLIISTQASEDAAVLSTLVDYGESVQKGEIIDPSFHLTKYAVPADADPFDESKWILANPALGDFRSLDELRQYSSRARSLPAMMNSFRNLYLNQRVAAVANFVDEVTWARCGGTFDMDSLEGKSCTAGLDLSSKVDLTALVLVFDDPQVVVPFFWTPQSTLAERSRRDKVPYERWADLGYIEAVPGVAIDFRFVVQQLALLSGIYNIRMLGFDRWRVDVFKTWMDEYGVEVPMTPIGQGFKDGSLMVDSLETAMLNCTIVHDDHPVLKWNALNTKVITDPAGNRKFDKSSRTARIDGFVAMAMAMRAKELVETPQDMSSAILVI